MTLLISLVLAILWGFIGYLLRTTTKLSVVEVSAWLTLIAGLFLPRVFQEGSLFALICTAVSYVVMSSSKRISNMRGILEVSTVCALVVFFCRNLLVGVGGRLGTFAALSVLAVVLVGSILKGGDNCDQCQAKN